MKTLLITGATGFIGRHVLLTPRLTEQFTVHALTKELLSPALNSLPIHWHTLDLHSLTELDNLLKNIAPTHLLHLAWYAEPEKYWHSEINLSWLFSSLHLLKSFIKNGGRRATFVGSCAEYDWQQEHCHEITSLCAPHTLYGAAKHSLYLLSQTLAEQQSLSFSWARPFFLFGPTEYPQRLVPALINTLLKNQSFIIKNGYQLRDFMYVKDVASAMIALLDSTVCGPVNIASGNVLSIEQLAVNVAALLEKEKLVEFQTNIRQENKVISADVNRLHSEVMWHPQYTLLQALTETIQWWRVKHP